MARATPRTNKQCAVVFEEEVEQVPSEISVLCVALYGIIVQMYMEMLYAIGIQLTRRNKIYF